MIVPTFLDKEILFQDSAVGVLAALLALDVAILLAAAQPPREGETDGVAFVGATRGNVLAHKRMCDEILSSLGVRHERIEDLQAHGALAEAIGGGGANGEQIAHAVRALEEVPSVVCTDGERPLAKLRLNGDAAVEALARVGVSIAKGEEVVVSALEGERQAAVAQNVPLGVIAYVPHSYAALVGL